MAVVGVIIIIIIIIIIIKFVFKRLVGNLIKNFPVLVVVVEFVIIIIEVLSTLSYIYKYTYIIH
jgi:hypothetical protein